MKCLVIGYGSIGKRHAHLLKNLGCQVSIVTSQEVYNHSCYRSIEEAFLSSSFDYVIIANSTYLHYKTLENLICCNFEGIVLVEKPLFSEIEILPANKINKIFVAYNLRFHDLLSYAKKLLSEEKLITFSTYVGQYLPTWRGNRDYRKSYSAKKEQGGGVLRDLSHELDYCIWFCGLCNEVSAIGGHFSELEINSDDAYSIIMKCDLCPIVNLQLNYLDRTSRREISINTQRNSFFIDLVKGFLYVNGEIKLKSSDSGTDSYRRQHQAVLKNDFESLCSYNEGMYLVKLISQIEKTTISKVQIPV